MIRLDRDGAIGVLTFEVWTSSAQAFTQRLPRRPRLRRGPPKLMLTSLRPLLKLISR